MVLCLLLPVFLLGIHSAGAPHAEALETEGAETVTKIVCFGDSITFGYGAADPAACSYPALLHKALEEAFPTCAFEVVNAGISGQDTRQGLGRLDALLESGKPDWLLVEYGTNDLWTTREIEPEETENNLREMVRRAKAAGASVLLATLPPVWGFDEKVGELNRRMRAIAIEAEVPFVDLNTALSAALAEAGGLDERNAWLEFYVWGDDDEGVHPNEKGYELLTRAWLEALAARITEQGAVDTEESKSPS